MDRNINNEPVVSTENDDTGPNVTMIASTGTLTCSSAARINVVGPNTNSTNSLDVYGLLGMSIANSNTFYGINAYYSGGWRPIRNGYSCYYKLDVQVVG